MSLLRAIWQGFQRLFGLNTCEAPLPPRRETPAQRATRERLERRLRGEGGAPTNPGAPTAPTGG